MKTNLLFEQCLSKVNPKTRKEVRNNMKTIEERAKLAQTQMPKTSSPYVMFREGYLKGATEQKAIAERESGKELLYVVNKTTERVRKEMIDKACGALDDVYFPSEESREKAKQIVRKAMMEI